MMISPLLRTACLLLALGCLATLAGTCAIAGRSPAAGPEPNEPVIELLIGFV